MDCNVYRYAWSTTRFSWLKERVKCVIFVKYMVSANGVPEGMMLFR